MAQHEGSRFTNFRDIPAWSSQAEDTKTDEDSAVFESAASTTSRAPFPFSAALNAKVSVWSGDVTTLMIEAIVNSTNESFDEHGPMSSRVFAVAGPDLRSECCSLGDLSTGEVKITKAYRLPCRFVLHTVGPRFNGQFQTAAESALYRSYREALHCLREHGLASLAIIPVNSTLRGYPTLLGTHTTLRTVRRFLEKYGDSIERIVFALEDREDIAAYSALMPAYFPRSVEEQFSTLSLLPCDLGNEDGEPVIEERQIRIQSELFEHEDDEEDSSLSAQLQAVNFGAVEPDRDRLRIERISKETERELAAQRVYKEWVAI
eukprot:m.254814 g.254814  ORF g.254814 m.254814 type:complete len:319 (-) comp54540_c1_seq1:183-1139(-)